MPTFTGHNIGHHIISVSEDTVTVAKTATFVAASGTAITESTGVHDNTINLYGIVHAQPTDGTTAIVTNGDRTIINIGKTAFVSSYNVLTVYGDNARITNEGTLSAATTGGGGAGIYVDGAGSRLINGGLVSGNNAIVLETGDLSFLNKADGQIIGFTHGVWCASHVDEVINVVNHGTITKVRGGDAITGGDGIEHIRNDGFINGFVRLGGGDDIVDNRGGKAQAFIFGEDGNDTLIVNKADLALIEALNEGHDTVKSSASYALSANVEVLILTGNKNLKGTGSADGNELNGNSGKNILLGLAGADTLDGGKGNDRLTGGTDADLFVFHRKGGVDAITDYVDEVDRIAILGFGNIDSFQKLSRRIDQHGDDVWITLGGGDKLIVRDTDNSTLEQTDFDFAS